jgi:hypothetical protein
MPARWVNTLPTASASGWRPLRVPHTGRWFLGQHQKAKLAYAAMQRLASGLA